MAEFEGAETEAETETNRDETAATPKAAARGFIPGTPKKIRGR
jgi:hypothetical protein